MLGSLFALIRGVSKRILRVETRVLREILGGGMPQWQVLMSTFSEFDGRNWDGLRFWKMTALRKPVTAFGSCVGAVLVVSFLVGRVC